MWLLLLERLGVPGPGQGLDPAEPAARYPPKEQASPQGKQSIMET